MPLANVDAPMGFRLLKQGGKREVRRTTRVVVDAENDLMIGDAYIDNGDGTVKRATAANATVVGIVEGIVLNPIPASPNGPVSQDYIPLAQGGSIIGIEDADAEFEVMSEDAVDTLVPGITMQLVDVDGSRLLRQSRQSVNATPVGPFVFLGSKDSPADNDPTAAFCRVVVRVAATVQA